MHIFATARNSAHLAAVFAFAIIGVTADAPSTLEDTPYTEIVSERHVFNGTWSPVPTGWIVAPSPVVSVAALSNGWVCVLADGSLRTGDNCDVAIAAPVAASPPTVVTAVGDNSSLLLIVTATSATVAACDLGAAPTCSAIASAALPNLLVTTAAAYSHASAPGVFIVWIGSATGTTAYNATSTSYQQVLNLPAVATAMAFTTVPARVMAVGGAQHLRLYDADTFSLVSSEWVTNIAQGWGAPIDDVITSMVYAPDGTLYVGNPTCLNVMYTDGRIIRISGAAGLPYGNITSLAMDARTGEWPSRPAAAARVWIGTDAGAILFDPIAPADNGGLLWLSPTAVTLQQRWRYMNGARYLVPSPDQVGFTGVRPAGIASIGNSTLVLTSDGFAVLTAQSWTLQQKAAWFEALLPRHDRLGMGLIADCGMPAFGLAANCSNTPCESNGLWTGIQLAAEVYRYAATQDPAALSAAIHFATGMQLLINATGDAAFPARSVSSPAEPAPSGGWWHNSTVYPGWYWMGDTSSDSTTGHMLAYAAYSSLLLSAAPGADAVNTSSLLIDIVSGVVSNGFTLIDPSTGEATRWGRWDPASLNNNQSWCDERGVNSVQIIAFLTAGIALSDPTSLQHAQMVQALNELVSPAQAYAGNALNAKIEAPCDDNYSDDELTFLPYAVFCLTASAASVSSPLQTAIRASVQRTYEYVQAWRPDLWTVIAIGCNATGAASAQKLAGDVWWNLATWPLELIDWPTRNSQRLDVVVNPEEDRDLVMGTESLYVLPANERVQFRWNADPFTLDDGSGRDETEPGAWLLPYWMARYQGWLQGAGGGSQVRP